MTTVVYFSCHIWSTCDHGNRGRFKRLGYYICFLSARVFKLLVGVTVFFRENRGNFSGHLVSNGEQLLGKVASIAYLGCWSVSTV